ncbi:MAG: tRNA (N(6)-L-threonylcarbamoyladenosine(37)-C(2))-methylthiotransferase MtaB [Halanaerobiales bacterium]
MPAVAFHTIGCKVNHYETEAMMDLFKNKGYTIVNFENIADIYIINSCTVTNQAARKSRKFARRAKRRNPEAIVVMVGCYSQVSPDEIREIEEIDLIVGTGNKEKIVKMVEKVSQNNEDLNTILNYKELTEYEDLKINQLRETTRGNIKIEEGCNQFCSYCIIPYARGPVRSREMDSVISEINNLIQQGVKEIILTGIHLGAYGYDWNDDDALVKLVEKIINLNNMGRVRLSSIEITEIKHKLIEIMKKSSRFCNHFHLPLQSGSNNILKKMNRPYTVEDFREKVIEIRKEVPEVAITTDVMVGFPGETDRDFQETYNFIKNIEFSRLHVFPYSEREGTKAAEMKDKVHSKVKKERSKKLRNLNRKLMKKYQQKFIGKIKKVIIEEKRDHKTGLLTGVTDNYIKVLIKGKDSLQGKMVEVKITGIEDYSAARGDII